MSDFGVDDKIYRVDLYDKINQFDNDLPFYRDLCKKTSGPVLELCCGSGRLTIPLAKAGINITGMDYTESMLDEAKRKAKNENLIVELLQGDMRKFSLNRKFSLIFIPFNSIQNTYTHEDINLIFNCVRKHLDDGGTFAFDIFNPDFKILARTDNQIEDLFNFELDSGERVTIKQSMKYDKVNQINRAKWHYDIDGKKHIERLDMRCFFPQEMDSIIKYNGFKIVNKFGDFDRNSFKDESKKQIYTCVLATT